MNYDFISFTPTSECTRKVPDHGGKCGPAPGTAEDVRLDTTAVDGVDLDIADGEFLTLLGPSGSGKTTVLRMIAGFELPTSGRSSSTVPTSPAGPFERNVNTVFQDYALFPHMTVQQNVEYGLKVRKGVGKAERLRRSPRSRAYGSGSSARASPASCPAASGSASRSPAPSSTAPRSCCSTSRSARSTSSCARRCRSSSRRSSAQVGITFVFVTHDQEEALTMSDRIAVFNAGRIEQVGTPAEVYERPASPFVAGFVGTSNLLEGDAAGALLGHEGVFSVRPEKIRPRRPGRSGTTGRAHRPRDGPSRSSMRARRRGSSSTSTPAAP